MKIGKQIALLALVLVLAVAGSAAIVWFGSSRVQAENGLPEDAQPAKQSSAEPRQSANDQPAGEIDEGSPENGEDEQEEAEGELLYQSLGNGICCVLGPGGVRDACVVIPKLSPAGERVAKIAPRAFYGCEWISAVQIPETVREIGALAFADCKNLVYISVNGQNPVYCDEDGVLYTADKRVLLQYPPLRAGDPLCLPASVTAVSEMAFYGCKNLKSVLYAGSGEDWERIEIGARNYDLVAASISFSASGE